MNVFCIIGPSGFHLPVLSHGKSVDGVGTMPDNPTFVYFITKSGTTFSDTGGYRKENRGKEGFSTLLNLSNNSNKLDLSCANLISN